MKTPYQKAVRAAGERKTRATERLNKTIARRLAKIEQRLHLDMAQARTLLFDDQ